MSAAGRDACAGCDRVAAALGGTDPNLIAALEHGVLVLGDHQAYGGYAVLWSRIHCVELHHLDPGAYAGFMDDLRRASLAVERATGCLKLNTVVLGNVVRHSHVHLFPRRADEPDRLAHPWVLERRFHEPVSEETRRHWVRFIREGLA